MGIYITSTDLSGFKIYRSSDGGTIETCRYKTADATSYIDRPSDGLYSYKVAATMI